MITAFFKEAGQNSKRSHGSNASIWNPLPNTNEQLKSKVQSFWEDNPLAASAIPFEPGTPEFFKEHTRLRNLEISDDMEKWGYESSATAGKKLLDIGCGNGFVTCLYARAGAEVSSVDITDKAVELTKARLGVERLSADVKQADAENLPFDDEYFDFVVSFGVLHHTPDTASAVAEAYRVLKPGGRVLLMLYHRNSFAYQLLFRVKRLLQPAWRGKSAADQVNAVDGMGNPLGKVYSKKEVTELLSEFSEHEYKSAGMFFNREQLIPGPLRKLIESRWGWHLFIKANKPETDN
jgi:ubiquinone/menaquinone biosynthesis C-methylase UbiE